mmetsp:Transcript_25285/g.51754  ORF Transcript_25285/g.51754 Transcript_25285/m.51754 type:complete len:215 (-) Transcript_25285:182-826(-)
MMAVNGPMTDTEAMITTLAAEMEEEAVTEARPESRTMATDPMTDTAPLLPTTDTDLTITTPVVVDMARPEKAMEVTVTPAGPTMDTEATITITEEVSCPSPERLRHQKEERHRHRREERVRQPSPERHRLPKEEKPISFSPRRTRSPSPDTETRTTSTIGTEAATATMDTWTTTVTTTSTMDTRGGETPDDSELRKGNELVSLSPCAHIIRTSL